MVHSPILYSNALAESPAGEEADIQKIVASLKEILQHSHQENGEYNPDVHVKTHGYARGTLHVVPALPPELAQGLFEKETVKSVVVRFSNAAGKVQPDAIPNGRGMAVKVLDVDGPLIETDNGPAQDFVMINHPVFVAADVKAYLRIQEVLAKAQGNTAKIASGVLTDGDWRHPLEWHWRELFKAL